MNKLAVGTGTAVAALGAALLLSGCGVNLSATVYHDDSRYTLDGDQLKQLTLDIRDGNADIQGVDGTSIQVHEYLSYTKDHKPTTSHSKQGGTVTLGYKCPGGVTIGQHECTVSYTVQMPRALALQMSDRSGNATLRGLSGDVQAHVQSGGIEADALQVSGNATLRADSGSVVLNGGSANTLEIVSRSGNVTFTGLKSHSVHVQTGSGNLGLDFAEAPTFLEASTSSGNARVSVPNGRTYEVNATSSSGRPTIAVPNHPGAPYKLHLRSESGNVEVTSNV